MKPFNFGISERSIIPLLLAGGLAGCQPGQPTDADPAVGSPSVATETPSIRPGSPPPKAYETFDVVWETIESRHFDPEHNGVDWDAVRLEYRPMVEDTRSEAEVRRILSQMIGELGQSHFVIIPGSEGSEEPEGSEESDGSGTPAVAGERGEPGPTESATSPDASETVSTDAKQTTGSPPATTPEETDVRQDAADDAGDMGNTGVRLDWADGVPTVAFVREGGTGALAGVRPGWRLRKIDGRDPSARIAAVRAAAREADAAIADFEAVQMLNSSMTGMIGETRTFTFLDEDDELTEVELGFAGEPGVPVKFGNLPAMTTRCTSRLLTRAELEAFGANLAEGVPTPRIVLLTFNVWMFPIMQPIAAAVDANRDADGFIIDLRGNPGGVGGLSMGVAGQFIDEAASLGDMITRDTTMHFRVNPQRSTPDGRIVKPYAGPLAIIIDNASASTSEIFAAGLQQLDRATVVGRNSAGAALPALVINLPNGDRFMYAMANFTGPEGRSIEGGGVKPDLEVALTRDELLEVGDPDLATAVEWILDAEKARP